MWSRIRRLPLRALRTACCRLVPASSSGRAICWPCFRRWPLPASFGVSDVQYFITFAIMLIVALIIGTLNASVRQQARIAGYRERRTALLYEMSRQLAMARGRDEMAGVAVRHVSQVFTSRAVLLFCDEQGHVVYPRAGLLDVSYAGADLGVAQWVFDHRKPAGMGTDTLSGSPRLHLPAARAEAGFRVTVAPA